MANLQLSPQQLTKGQENVIYLYEKYSKEYHNPLEELTRFLFQAMADQDKAQELHQFLLGYIKEKSKHNALRLKFGKKIQDIINNYGLKYPVVTMNNPFIAWASRKGFVRVLSATQQEFTSKGFQYFFGK